MTTTQRLDLRRYFYPFLFFPLPRLGGLAAGGCAGVLCCCHLTVNFGGVRFCRGALSTNASRLVEPALSRGENLNWRFLARGGRASPMFMFCLVMKWPSDRGDCNCNLGRREAGSGCLLASCLLASAYLPRPTCLDNDVSLERGRSNKVGAIAPASSYLLLPADLPSLTASDETKITELNLARGRCSHVRTSSNSPFSSVSSIWHSVFQLPIHRVQSLLLETLVDFARAPSRATLPSRASQGLLEAAHISSINIIFAFIVLLSPDPLRRCYGAT